MISPCCTYETFRVKNKSLDLELDVCRKCGKPWVVTEEEWVPVEGFPIYEVSTTGQVRRNRMKVGGKYDRKRCYGPKNLKQTDTASYRRVTLNSSGTKYSPYVHNLVAENWVLNPHGYKKIEHITGNIYDNSYLNLKWVPE